MTPAMGTVELRPLTEADRTRILEISSQIWDGNDWVPAALDEWLTDPSGDAVGAILDGCLAGFARRTWLAPGLAWFEGIRTDPAYRGRGVGRAITGYLIENTRAAGASRIHLSTYIDNRASIYIIESFGFERVATFTYRERPSAAPPTPEVKVDPRLAPVPADEAIAFIADSPFLRLAGRRFPRGWRFFPFDHDPHEATARLEYRLGCYEGETLAALLCARSRPGVSDRTVFNFLDGEPEPMKPILRHALHVYAGTEIAMMVPVSDGRSARIGPLLDECGFTTWSEGVPDVFVYELSLER